MQSVSFNLRVFAFILGKPYRNCAIFNLMNRAQATKIDDYTIYSLLYKQCNLNTVRVYAFPDEFLLVILCWSSSSFSLLLPDCTPEPLQ